MELLGLLGKRDRDYRMVIACGVSIKYDTPKLLVLTSPIEVDYYYYDESLAEYVDFSQEVVEMLFYREGDGFNFFLLTDF